MFDKVTKRFGATVAVNEISGSIASGVFFGICGPNGAGKTTLLNMSTGLLRPDSGSVVVAGSSVWDDPIAAKARIGVVPDNPSMFPRLTGRELLEFHGLLRRLAPEMIAERSSELLEVLGLADAADTMVSDYSLGMTKKLAIAAALLHDPAVLFLDEPFAGIDPVSRQVLEVLLQRYVDGSGTVVFSDHAMDVVQRLCDQILIVDHGQVLAAGPVSDITGGRRLQDVFVEMVGGGDAGKDGLTWLGSSSG